MANAARILVVDDEPDTLGLIELTLQTAGYEVRTAASGEQALTMLRQDTYDLILLDLMMPDVSGFDVLRRLRGDQAQPPPVVILTAKNSREDQDTGRNLGAAGYLVKPTTRGQLLDAVEGALAGSPPNASP